jgi:HlyD family secretion protein
MKRGPAIAVIVLACVAVGLWWWQSHRSTAAKPFLGYVEGETVLVAPKQTGRLIVINTAEGRDVAAGAPLFALDSADESAAVAEATARLDQARAVLADLHAARQRPAEIEALQARKRQAEAALELSRAELERQQKLFKQKVIAEARLDQARTTYRRDENALAEVERQIDAAGLAGRSAEIDAAAASVKASEAALERAQIALAERSVAAPDAGRVLDILYRNGEIVTAGQPVVELLPPANILVRFYVPETAIAQLRQGQAVAIACDGCPDGLGGKISFIASEAEFTPPVIFSRQERSKLVFLVEARTAKDGKPAPALKPGLPVEVRPQQAN